jgi:hypothetical protein
MIVERRVEELLNLRRALAIFAIQLDAFEARLNSSSFQKSVVRSPRLPDLEFAKLIADAMSDRTK